MFRRGPSKALTKFKGTPKGTKDSFTFQGKKYLITNNRGAHAGVIGKNGKYTRIPAEEYFRMKKLGRYTKVTGVGTAVASGAFTALEEFGGNNNHSTAKKVGKTAGSVAGAALGAKLLTGLIAAIPTIGPAIAPILGPTIGGVIGNWVGGGFSNDARRNRFKGKFGIDSLTGDYSVRQLKRFNRFKNGDLSALTAEDIRMLKRNGL